MTLEPIGIILFFIIAASFFCRLETVATIMGCLTMFVASSAISIGTFTLNPALIFLPVFAFRATSANRKLSSISQNQSAALLTQQTLFLGFLIYAFIVTIFCPRLFAGDILVVWPSRDTLNSLPTPLQPGGGNLTQGGYALAAAVCFFSAQLAFRKVERTDAIVVAVIAIAVLNITLSAVDLISFYAGTDAIMALIRNGNYYILSGDTVAGTKRTIGTFTEASVYAIYNLAIFAFLFSLFRQRIRPRVTGILAIVTFVFLVLSLSTTAFVGIALYIFRLAISGIYRIFIKGRTSAQSVTGLAMLVALICGGTFFYIANDGIPLLDEIIFKKGISASGIERATLNESAWNAFTGSYGLGVGLGSTRASSFFLVLLSNTGIIGTLLYGAFLYKSLALPKGTSLSLQASSSIVACREAVIGYLIAASLSYAVFDLGLLVYILTGAATAIALKQPSHQQTRNPRTILNRINRPA